MAIFKGAGVAIATPFKENGEVNYEEFARLIEFQIENGTDAIIVCGTTGEAATMSEEEHMEVVKFCIEKVGKRIPVIAGTGSNCTETAVKLSKLAEEYGADGLLLVTPYYNKATQGGLIAHFEAVAKEVNIPILLYNVPSRTGCNILPETAVKLCRDNKNIVGINVSALERFENGSEVTVETLIESGVVSNPKDGVKILGNGELTKKLTVKANAFSQAAKEKIEALGGTCEVI